MVFDIETSESSLNLVTYAIVMEINMASWNILYYIKY